MTQAVLVILAFHVVMWSGVALLVRLEPPRWPRVDQEAEVTRLPLAPAAGPDVGPYVGEDGERPRLSA